MTDPRRKIEKFCYEHPNFGIPNLMRYIVIANVVFWLLGAVNPVLMSYLLFNPALILRGQVWRLVSFVFFPPSTGILAFIAFYFYYWIGSTLENQWGTGQFTIYFFSGVILTILYGFVMYFITGRAVSLSSTYIYLSMFFSFAALFPDMQVLFLFFIPVKMKYLALVNAAFFLISVFTTAFPENLLPVVAVLNFLIFCGGEAQVPAAAKAEPAHHQLQTRIRPHPPGAAGQALHPQVRRLRQDGRGLPESGVSLLLPLRGLPLLLQRAYQQSHPLYGVIAYK